MIRKILSVLVAALILTGCGGRKDSVPDKIQPVIGSQNPGSYPVKNPLLEKLALFSQDSLLRHALLSYCFIEAGSDSVIAMLNPDLSLVPASTLKLFTTAAALEILGPETRFKTTLQYEGRITGRTLHGNIILKGGGDPTFCLSEPNKKLIFSNWTKALKRLGIDTLDGSVVGDGTVFDMDYIPYTWTWGEINLAYCAAASGLSVNGNIYELNFEPLKQRWFAADLKRVTPYIPEEEYFNRVAEAEVDKELIYLIGHPFTNQRMIRGTMPKGTAGVSVAAAISNPPLVAASEFLIALRQDGIAVSGKAFSLADSDSITDRLNRGEIRNITSVSSPTLESIVFTVNQLSYNFYAENLLKQVGLKVLKHGGTESGALAVYRFWKERGMDMGGFAMFDGCGISRFNTVTARQLTWLLKYMQSSEVYNPFFNSLSIAGVSGTLHTMCFNSPAKGNVHAKGGTMSRVRSYAGYAATRSGKTIIFSIMVNNFDGPSTEVREKIGRILDAVVQN